MLWQHSQMEQGLNVLYNDPVNRQPTNNNAVQFDGLSNYVTFNDFLFQNNDYTVEIWIKDFGTQISSFNGYNYIWYCYYDRIGIYQGNSIDFVTRAGSFFNDYYIYYSDVAGFSVNSWTQLVLRFTLSGLVKDIFINGTLQATTTLNSVGNGNAGLISVGAAKAPGGSPLAYTKCKVGQLKIYTRAISNAEVQYSYNTGSGNLPFSTAQLAHWITWDNSSAHNFGYLGSQYSGQFFNFVPSEFIPR